VLSAADIAVTLDADHTDLPVQVATVLATVLREGVTNLLRHSKAKHCAITIRQAYDDAWLEIVNDDHRPEKDRVTPNRDRGGLHNLTVRAAEIGGTLTVRHEDNVFRLHVRVPLRQVRRGSQPAGVARDADRVDPVAGGQLADDRGEVVADGPD